LVGDEQIYFNIRKDFICCKLLLPPLPPGGSIGEHTIDLRTEIIVKENAELLDMLEKASGV
jgi:hypothetical protein